MKLKYYLRGMGIGILLSTIILSISFHNSNKQTQTNTAESQKATEASDEKVNLEDLLKPSEAQTEEQKSSTETTVANEAETEKLDSSKTAESESTKAEESESTKADESSSTKNTESASTKNTESGTVSTSKATEATKAETKTSETKSKTASSEASPVMFEIKKGMTSEQVANVLEACGLIKNSKDFNQYLKKNGYASIIDYGKYNITKGATYEQIAKTISQ